MAGKSALNRRTLVRSWMQAGIDAVDPESLTAHALTGWEGPASVIAIGKAAAGMCRGADRVLRSLVGLCVTNQRAEVPPGIELMIGDHPIPGEASLAAGLRALELASEADLALISGGGSALCEVPLPGVDLDYTALLTQRLIDTGANIEEVNLVRSHLSLIKGGGLGPLPTFVLSDVAGAGPEVVSSGPTIPGRHEPAAVTAIIERLAIPVPDELASLLREHREDKRWPEVVHVIGDGKTAAAGVVAAVPPDVAPATIEDEWLGGGVEECLHDFIENSGPGVTVAAGEPSVAALGPGRGGRNTHAALLAASMIRGTGLVFAAIATDGIDGTSEAAGGIVDGSTVDRGGDPTAALTECDSATYLGATGDAIVIGPTGTNVADLWLVWKPYE